MLRETLIQIYTGDLQKVIKEINLYKSEEDLWKLDEGIANSGGNLALHLIGNIKHFFGANLGDTGYRREREQEFAGKNISRAEIIDGLEQAIDVLQDTLNNLADEDLHQEYPEVLGDKPQKSISIIIYMLSHLNYHLGQINYHRRLFSK